MLASLRARSWFHWLLFVACVGALIAACGSNGTKQTGGTTGGAGTGSGAGTTTGHGGGSHAGGGGNLGLPDGGGNETLTVSPATATITIVDTTTALTQPFGALLDGSPVNGPVTWTLDTYAEGSISAAGLFTTTGIVGGLVTVTATFGNLTATAQLTVNVNISQTVLQGATDPGPSAQNVTALMGPAMADPGAGLSPPNATQILYPYDKTVMPRGLVAPLLQFSPGNLPPVDAMVAMSSTYFTWQGLIHVQNGMVPQFSIPQNIWDGALLSTGGSTLTINVTKAANGVAYGPATTSIIVAAASLQGAVYYMTYDTPGNGLYSVLPGVKQPATLLVSGCLVCHAVSANGTQLALGTDDATVAAQSGIYDVSASGMATQITQSPPGLGGDTRGISFATFTPDGQYVMRSQDNFWGGVNQEAWKIDDVAQTLTPATVVGLGPNISAFVPAISPDGLHYAFTNGDGETPAFGTYHRSISLMDLAVDSATNTLTFSNRQLILDNGATGNVAKFVTFMPDPTYIVLEEGSNFCQQYGEMLPSWDVTCADYSFTGSTGSLFMINTSTLEHIELANVNAGIAAVDATRNYEPFALEVTAGGYFWVVFTSIREYGNTYTGAGVKKQLWVAAISTNPAAGVDPSHPPFYLPNQSATRNERGFWALQPCLPDGSSCQTGDQCCDGFCRPSDPNDPSSPTICQAPMAGSCSEIAEKCSMSSDCCGVATGVTCIGGFCSPQSPM
jgi:hypothetical protein